MDEPKRTPVAETEGATSEQAGPPEVSTSPAAHALESAFARGSGQMSEVAPERSERTEHSIMEGLPQAKAERVAAMRRELAELQRQLIEAQQKIATELQGRADDAERFEALEARLQAHEAKAQQEGTRVTELEAEIATLRAQVASATTARDDLDKEVASLREAKALLETRDADLATVTSERDALKGELLQVRGEVEATRTRTRDVATQLVRFAQGLTDGEGAGTAAATASEPESKPAAAPPAAAAAPPPAVAAERPQPPPVPVHRAKPKTQELEIFEVSNEEKAPSARIGWLVFGAVVLSSVATIGVMKLMSSSSASPRHDVGGAAPAALAAPVASQPAPAPSPSPVVAPPPASASPLVEPVITAPSQEEVAAPSAPVPTPTPTAAAAAEVPTDGTLLLPEEAEGHRLYVDGRIVRVSDLRAVVRCGTREIQIGSRGTARKVEVACGGETAIAPDAQDR